MNEHKEPQINSNETEKPQHDTLLSGFEKYALIYVLSITSLIIWTLVGLLAFRILFFMTTGDIPYSGRHFIFVVLLIFMALNTLFAYRQCFHAWQGKVSSSKLALSNLAGLVSLVLIGSIIS